MPRKTEETEADPIDAVCRELGITRKELEARARKNRETARQRRIETWQAEYQEWLNEFNRSRAHVSSVYHLTATLP